MLIKAQRRDPERPPPALGEPLCFLSRLLGNSSNTAAAAAHRRAFAGNARYYRNKLGFDFCHFYHLSHKPAARLFFFRGGGYPSVCLTRVRCLGLDTPSLIRRIPNPLSFLSQQQHAVGIPGGAPHRRRQRVRGPLLQSDAATQEEASVGHLREEGQS